MAAPESIRVTVVYARPEHQAVVALDVTAGTSVAQAVEQSQLLLQFPEITAHALTCAIFGRAVTNEQQLRAGDRIEILRPLLIDPKEGRRQAAARARKPRPN